MTENDTSPPVVPGDRIAGKYRVERVLGAGGMGVVVAATHEHLDQRVALKFLQAAAAQRGDIVQRFLREARAAVKIHSEHVARVLDVGTLETGVPYMVMEYLDGADLSQVIAARGSLPVEEAVGYVLEACEAVAEAHSLGIVHRDIKPANLFLARRPTGSPIVKVLDFGISKVSSDGGNDAITKTSSLMGSPGYMSPEQMVDAKSVDARTDVWSLGVVLYEMLSRRLPFAGDTMPELIAAILQKTPAPLASLRPDVPVGIQSAVDRCLQKVPAGRYANVAELARALGPFGPPRAEQSVERIEHVLGFRGRTLLAPTPAADGLARSDPATLQPMTTAAGAPRWARVLVPGALVLAGIGAALAFGLRSPKGAPTSSSVPAAAGASTPSGAPVPAGPAAERSSAVAPPVNAPAVSLAPLAESSAPPPAESSQLVPAATPTSRRGAPTAPGAKTEPRPPASSSSAALSAAPSSAPCRVVSYFDADGQKHFKQECP